MGGHATMDSVSHPPNVVMETQSAMMGVMNSIAVSIVLFASLHHTFHAHLVEHFQNGLIVEVVSHPSNTNTLCLLQYAPVLTGGVAMDSVSHPPNVVMENGSAMMGVMSSIAVSIVLFACFSRVTPFMPTWYNVPQWVISGSNITSIRY